jgi:uncharacterized protein (DUF952 family)/predicted N-acetyltransferase YhbS
MNSLCIYHIVDAGLWESGEDPWVPSSFEVDGFIHCSYHRQVGPTLRRFFSLEPAGAEAEAGTVRPGLAVLEIDPFRTDAVIRAEAGTGGEVDPDGKPELFPHLYGPLPRRAVTAVRETRDFLSHPSGTTYTVATAGGYTITEERRALSVDIAATFLAEESYWARGRSRKTVALSIENAWVLTLVAPDGTMAGMTRVITDWATMYYLSDLFVLPGHRGRGLGKALVRAVVGHPRLCRLKGVLRTADAHGLYEQFGFERDGPDSRGMRRPESPADITNRH